MDGLWGLLLCQHQPKLLLHLRRYDFLAQLATYPTYTCIIAYSGAYDYDTVSASRQKWPALPA
jgi:hypothetical protein